MTNKPSGSPSGFIEKVIRPEIRALAAYGVADAGDLIKLDAMENPYPLPDHLIDSWLDSLRHAALNRYPDADAAELRRQIRRTMGVPDQFDVLLGNGSDEIIQMLCLAAQGPKPVVLAPAPSFVMYQMIAQFTGLQFQAVPLTDDFQLDEQQMLAQIDRYQPALVFLSYPNNPTGNLFDEQVMRRIVQAAPGLVVVDEAYYVFAESSAIDWLQQYPNLLVMRTLSKLGLAGLRLGMVFGHHDWLAHINKVRLPYNINSLTQATVAFLLNHWDVLLQQARQIKQQRIRMIQALTALPGVSCYPSDANFVLLRLSNQSAQKVFEQLKQKGVLIKLMPQNGVLANCLRVTVGQSGENDQFLQKFSECLQ